MASLEQLILQAGSLPNIHLPKEDPSLYLEIRKLALREGRSGRVAEILGVSPVIFKTPDPLQGFTPSSLDVIRKYKSRIGNLLYVACYKKNDNYWTWFVGDRSSIKLGGFSWGYGGTGPHGFLEALQILGVLTPRAKNKIFSETRDYWILLI